MKTRDAVLTAVWAAAAMTVSLAVMSPTPLTAEDAQVAQAEKLPEPTLAINSIKISAKWADAKNPLTSDKPMLLLSVANTSDADAAANCRVALMVESPGRADSRVLLLPRSMWQQDVSISLKGGEKKTIELAIDKKPAGAGGGYVLLSQPNMPATNTLAVTQVSTAAFTLGVIVQSAPQTTAQLQQAAQ